MPEFSSLADELLSDQTKENYKIIFRLIQRHWCLDSGSIHMIKKRLFEDPLYNFNEEIITMMQQNGMQDLRASVLSETGASKDALTIDTDTGLTVYHLFKMLFFDYIVYHSVTLEEFMEGKVDIGKGQKVKLQKHIIQYYTKDGKGKIADSSLTHFHVLKFMYSMYMLLLPKSYNQIIAFANIFIKQYMNKEFCSVDATPDYMFNTIMVSAAEQLKNISIQENDYTNKQHIANMVNTLFNMISTVATSTKSNIDIVATLNFSDWFLSSTNEKWTSCLSLDSEYSAMYWAGLPGVIANPNRFMVYGNSKNATKEWNDIKTHSFSFRSWVEHVYLESDKSKERFACINFYPRRIYSMEYFKDDRFISVQHLKAEYRYHSITPFEPLRYNSSINEHSCYIYQDGSEWEKYDNTQVKTFIDTDSKSRGAHYLFNNNDLEQEDVFLEAVSDDILGLNNLIKNGMDLSEIYIYKDHRIYSEYEDEYFDEEDVEWVETVSSYVSHDCIRENFIYTFYNNTLMHIDDTIAVERLYNNYSDTVFVSEYEVQNHQWMFENASVNEVIDYFRKNKGSEDVIVYDEWQSTLITLEGAKVFVKENDTVEITNLTVFPFSISEFVEVESDIWYHIASKQYEELQADS